MKKSIKIGALVLAVVLLATLLLSCDLPALRGTYENNLGGYLTFKGDEVWGHAASGYLYEEGCVYRIEDGKMRIFAEDGETMLEEFPYERISRKSFTLTMLGVVVEFTK